MLVDGFFPLVKLDEKPLPRRSGFQEFSLPYAADAAITRVSGGVFDAHRHRDVRVERGTTNEASPSQLRSATHKPAIPARPDVVLFNGGVFDASVLRERLLEAISRWFPGESGNWGPQLLENERRDLAVARGAAYYGLVRRGLGVRIAAGLARSYYIGAATAEGAASAVCLMPAGVEEGQEIDLTQCRFNLRIREPVEFPLYVSSTQLTARAGDVAPIDPEQMTSLPPIRTVLQSGKKTAAAETIAVNLHARLTEIGTLDLWCGEIDGDAHVEIAVRCAGRARAPTWPAMKAPANWPASSIKRCSTPAGGWSTARLARLRTVSGEVARISRETLSGRDRDAALRLAAVAIAKPVGSADGSRSGAEAEPRARSPLAELARLRPAAGLRHGGRRLARRTNPAAVNRAGTQQPDVPRRMVDFVAPRCRRIAGRPAAVACAAAGGRRAGTAACRGQETGARNSSRARTKRPNCGGYWVRSNCSAWPTKWNSAAWWPIWHRAKRSRQ